MGRVRETDYKREHRARRKRAAIGYCGGECVDCGFNDLTRLEVFQFDHLPQFEKSTEIAKLLASATWERLEAELDKCELVCANCHATRTVGRVT